MKHPSKLALSVTALLAVAVAPAAADTDDDPDASATAVEIDGVATLSQTTASEDESSATVISVADETVVGGDSDGGDSSGEVLDTGETELGRATVGSWEASTDAQGSEAESSVASVTVRDEDTARATVLRSRSEADADGTGSAATSAAAVRLGGQDEIRVLSTIWDEDGPSSALVRQGDDTIGEDPDGQCALEIPSVLHLLCLTGSDSLGGTVAPGDSEHDETASIVEASVLGQQEAAVLHAGGDPAATGGVGDDAPAHAPTPAPASHLGGDDTALAGAPSSDHGPLPRTGGGLAAVAFGLLLLATGLVLRRTVSVV